MGEHTVDNKEFKAALEIFVLLIVVFTKTKTPITNLPY